MDPNFFIIKSLRPRFFCTPYSFAFKNFLGTINIFGPKKFLPKNFFQPKNFFGLKKFFGPKNYFCTQNFHLDQNFFGTKFFLTKNFQTQIFVDPKRSSLNQRLSKLNTLDLSLVVVLLLTSIGPFLRSKPNCLEIVL